jgi:hypothetical protein
VQALEKAKIIDPASESGPVSTQTRLEVNNFPETHTKEMIREICECFGEVKHIEMLKDPISNKFRGTVHVEFGSEMICQVAHNAMIGLKIEDEVL